MGRRVVGEMGGRDGVLEIEERVGAWMDGWMYELFYACMKYHRVVMLADAASI